MGTADDVVPFFAAAGITPTHQQRRAYDSVGQASSATIAIDAGPGCNKTTLATGVCLYATQKLLASQFDLIAWVVLSRNMRREILRLLRRYSMDESRIVSAGRASEEERNASYDDSLWDPKTIHFVAEKLAPLDERIKNLRQQVMAYGLEISAEHSNWSQYKTKAETLEKLWLLRCQTEIDIMSGLLQRAQIVCFTIDAFLQACSPGSRLPQCSLNLPSNNGFLFVMLRLQASCICCC